MEEAPDNYRLLLNCSLKNYDSEIEKFCDWIGPYVSEPDGADLGVSRYEEYENDTRLIFAGGKVEMRGPGGGNHIDY